MASDDGPETPPGAVRGRPWHRIVVAGVVGLLVAMGVLVGLLGLVDAIAGTGGNPGPASYLAASALLLGVAASAVTMLVMH